MIPSTPEQWLPVLTDELDDQIARIRRDRRYAKGQPDLPEMGANVRESWLRYQRRAVVDYGGLAVTSLCNRLVPQGVRIGDNDNHPALPIVRRILRDNRAPVLIAETIRDAEEVGVGYLTVTQGDDGPVLSSERPEQFYADPDPLRPWRARASIKVWRDKRAGLDHAWVWAGEWAQRFWRKNTDDSDRIRFGVSGGWAANGAAFRIGVDPTVIFERQGRIGLLHPHLDLIDQLNEGKLHRLVTTALQTFKLRAMKPGSDGQPLPEKDTDGNTIDWGKVLEMAPGAIWDLPVPVDIWESGTTDIRPLLEAERADLRTFAAVLGIPVAMLMPEQQSGTGAAQIPMQLVFMARAEIERFKPALDLAIVRLLRLAGVDLGDATVESLWVNPEYVTLQERYAAAVQAKGAGVSGRTIKRDILNMSPDAIRQDEADQGADMLVAALAGIGSGGTDSAAASSPDLG